MRRFVQPRRRKLSRRIIVRTESKNTSGVRLFLYYHRQKITALIVLIFGIYIAFFYNRSPIKQVAFTQDTYNTLEYSSLFESVTQKLIGKGYYKQKYSSRNEFISETKTQFPIVKDITPTAFNEGTLTINITYNNPDFMVETLDNSLWFVYRNGFIPYASGATLGETGMVLGITITKENIDNFSGGVFWKVGSLDLVKIINQISFLPKESLQLTYYPGREKLKVISNNGTFIISLDQKLLPKIFEKRENLIPYMPTADPYIADISDPDRITIKQ